MNMSQSSPESSTTSPPPSRMRSSRIFRNLPLIGRSHDKRTFRFAKTVSLGRALCPDWAPGKGWLGTAEVAPSKCSLEGTTRSSSGCARRTSGSGRRYGPSSILLPSLKQSSNLDGVSFQRASRLHQRDSPMWKHNLALELLVDGCLAFWVVQSQSAYMGSRPGHVLRLDTSKSQRSTDYSLLVV